MRGAKTKPVFSAIFIPSARLISPDPSLFTFKHHAFAPSVPPHVNRLSLSRNKRIFLNVRRFFCLDTTVIPDLIVAQRPYVPRFRVL